MKPTVWRPFSILGGILLALVGLICILFPSAISSALPIVFGTIIIVYVLLQTFFFIGTGTAFASPFFVFGSLLLSLVFGILLFVAANASFWFLALICGLWGIIVGIGDLIRAIRFRAPLIDALYAILCVAAGVLVLIFAFSDSFIILVGILMILRGGYAIYEACLLRS